MLNLFRNSRKKIIPAGIILFYEANLPRSIPALDLFFAGDGRVNIMMKFVPDEPVDAVLPGKSVGVFVSVLPNAFWKIARYAGVERLVPSARNHIDCVGLWHLGPLPAR